MKSLWVRVTVGTFTVPLFAPLAALHAADATRMEANVPAETTFDAAKSHPEPFLKAVLDVVSTDPAGAETPRRRFKPCSGMSSGTRC